MRKEQEFASNTEETEAFSPPEEEWFIAGEKGHNEEDRKSFEGRNDALATFILVAAIICGTALASPVTALAQYYLY